MKYYILLLIMLGSVFSFAQEMNVHKVDGTTITYELVEIDSITFQIGEFDCGSSFTDIRDGQIYNTVQIGGQCWMSENLNIGTHINGVNLQSDNSIIEKYCHNDDTTNCNIFGGLYQWDEMMQYVTTGGVQGICPTDWHLPIISEWTSLVDFLGGMFIAGGPLKETGYIYWFDPNAGATNSSGFSARGNGTRELNGSFGYLKSRAFYWTSSEIDGNNAYDRQLDYSDDDVATGNDIKNLGFSVRCIKD